jgi:dipeptidyl aminopeptidase/acylaminoacyl peptidase
MSAHAEIATRFIDGQTTVGAPAVSPDGTQVAYVVARVDLEANTTRSQIWLAPTDGSRPARPLTAGQQRDRSPAWSPDGAELAFASGRSETKGATTVHVLPLGVPGELRTIAELKDGCDRLRWSPDGRWLAFTSRTRDARYDAEDESWQSPRKVERFGSRLNGEDWVFDRPSHVYVVPADGGAAPINLTPGPFQHDGISWLADSSGVVTSAARHDDWDRDLATDLYVVPLDVEGRDTEHPHAGIRALTEHAGTYGSPSVSPDGRLLAFIGSDEPLTYPQNARVGVIDLGSGERAWITEALDRTFEPTSGVVPPVWLDDDTILANAEDRGTGHLFRLDPTGKVAPVAITEGPRWIRSFDAAGGQVVAAVATHDQPAELHGLGAGVATADGVRLSRNTDAYTSKVRPTAWEHFTVPCPEPTPGTTPEIDAWIIRPAGFDPTTRYPVLLNVHGGPHTQYGESFFDEAQFQAAAGFVVLMCNPRGSSGREEAWGQAIAGPKHPHIPGRGWGSVDVADILAVLDAALERYAFCDPARVGMLGGSYGGYMATLLAARHGDRFKAICSERAVNNLLSEEWSSDIATFFRAEHGPDHVSDPEEYLRMSPSQLAADIHVPMLLIHSEQDFRCPIVQAEELWVALRILRRDVTFYRFPGENHELSRSGSPLHRKQRAEIILDWFAERLAA